MGESGGQEPQKPGFWFRFRVGFYVAVGIALALAVAFFAQTYYAGWWH